MYYMTFWSSDWRVFNKPVQENRQILSIMYTCKTNLVILKDLATNSPLNVIFSWKNNPIVYILFKLYLIFVEKQNKRLKLTNWG